ncbi:hypothetical protein QE152_g35183 [Popillia japonica]|uniref:Mos1 transposase HTH domain-containing protein n=1 Tax=Popillia japonica TaxID=7064 RepID=A0AAW1IG69_POPJA
MSEQNIIRMRAHAQSVTTTCLSIRSKFRNYRLNGYAFIRVTICTRLKQRAVIEFLTTENITPTEIYRRLQVVYEAETVDRSTMNRWAIKSRNCEPGQLNISEEQRSGRPISASDACEHCSRVDNLIHSDRRITQQRIADALEI